MNPGLPRYSAILHYLAEAGWQVEPHRDLPEALSPNGEHVLSFHPHRIYLDEEALGLDPHRLDPASFLRHVERIIAEQEDYADNLDGEEADEDDEDADYLPLPPAPRSSRLGLPPRYSAPRLPPHPTSPRRSSRSEGSSAPWSARYPASPPPFPQASARPSADRELPPLPPAPPPSGSPRGRTAARTQPRAKTTPATATASGRTKPATTKRRSATASSAATKPRTSATKPRTSASPRTAKKPRTPARSAAPPRSTARSKSSRAPMSAAASAPPPLTKRAMQPLTRAFTRLQAQAQTQHPELAQVRLEVDPVIHQRSARSYGDARLTDQGPTICLAPELATCPACERDGVIGHELGHVVVLLGLVKPMRGYDAAERQADEIAERLFGQQIFYTENGKVQCMGKGAKGIRPRPKGLR